VTLASSKETVIIEGVVKRDPALVKRGLVLFLSPWWHGPAHFVDALLRVRIPNSQPMTSEPLAKGTPVRIACTNLEPPRTGASWWAATGAGAPHARDAGPRTKDADGASPALRAPTPVRVFDRFLGRLTLEPSSNVFRGSRRLTRRTYQVSIERSANADDRSADHRDLDRARAVLRALELALATIHHEVASHAQAIYHERWRGARARLTRNRVTARIALSAARIGVDGRVTLSFSEGDLFFGHWLEILLDASLRVQTVEVAGLQKVS